MEQGRWCLLCGWRGLGVYSTSQATGGAVWGVLIRPHGGDRQERWLRWEPEGQGVAVCHFSPCPHLLLLSVTRPFTYKPQGQAHKENGSLEEGNREASRDGVGVAACVFSRWSRCEVSCRNSSPAPHVQRQVANPPAAWPPPSGYQVPGPCSSFVCSCCIRSSLDNCSLQTRGWMGI